MTQLSLSQAERFAALPLRNLDREYPNNLTHFNLAAADVRPPHELHPIFWGSYDWHSCVHGWWLLTRCLRRHPQLNDAPRALGLYANFFTKAAGAGEAAYLDAPGRGTWQRPYGWGWLLALSAELSLWDQLPAPHWRTALLPLEQRIVARFPAYMEKLTYPIRVGTHFNTAFGLLLALHYARVTGEPTLEPAIMAYARKVYLPDTNYPAHYEPNGDDFLSGALTEALLMAELLPVTEFAAWWNRFLPAATTLFLPAIVSDRGDAKTVHLDGLNLSRAWCLRGIAARLPGDQSGLLQSAAAHEQASLPHLESGDYGGEHWLATFAALSVEGLAD
jgi:hypothetical protein